MIDDPRAVARLLCAIGRLIRTLIELISTVVRYSVIRHRPAHPSGEWTLQQLREAIPSDHEYRFLIRDRDRKFPEDLDPFIRHLGLRVLRTPRSGSDTSTQRGRIAP